MNHRLTHNGYIINHKGEIENIKYRDYLREFGSDETTTPMGVAPRLYVDGKNIYTWGVRGNNHKLFKMCKNNKEAKDILYGIFEDNVYSWGDAPRFFRTKKELFEDLSDLYDKDVKVIKRYFSIRSAQKEKLRQSKIKHDSRPLTTIQMMADYIQSNKEMVQTTLNELNELKRAENKELWQVKANSLVQKVCNNDFRTLNWKEVYNFTKTELI